MSRRQKHSKHEERVNRGIQQIVEDHTKSFDNDWKLDWFSPQGRQVDILDSVNTKTFTIVDAPSGCGKTTTALYKALSELKNGGFRRVVFIKNPTEVGDDKIGFLSGSENDKLVAHFETTKRIFQNFMSKNKLENDIKNEKIMLKIPNFLLGATLDNSIVIMDESQVNSPATVKLLLERIGKYSKYIVLGDSQQRYAVSNRQDGFKDLIERVTHDNYGVRYSKYNQFGYVKLTRDDNMRSDGSKLINQIYEV